MLLVMHLLWDLSVVEEELIEIRKVQETNGRDHQVWEGIIQSHGILGSKNLDILIDR
jgi:hypothetical protein